MPFEQLLLALCSQQEQGGLRELDLALRREFGLNKISIPKTTGLASTSTRLSLSQAFGTT
jgi:hypothetical protein